MDAHNKKEFDTWQENQFALLGVYIHYGKDYKKSSDRIGKLISKSPLKIIIFPGIIIHPSSDDKYMCQQISTLLNEYDRWNFTSETTHPDFFRVVDSEDEVHMLYRILPDTMINEAIESKKESYEREIKRIQSQLATLTEDLEKNGIVKKT